VLLKPKITNLPFILLISFKMQGKLDSRKTTTQESEKQKKHFMKQSFATLIYTFIPNKLIRSRYKLAPIQEIHRNRSVEAKCRKISVLHYWAYKEWHLHVSWKSMTTSRPSYPLIIRLWDMSNALQLFNKK
jgi:hypothetical protein